MRCSGTLPLKHPIISAVPAPMCAGDASSQQYIYSRNEFPWAPSMRPSPRSTSSTPATAAVRCCCVARLGCSAKPPPSRRKTSGNCSSRSAKLQAGQAGQARDAEASRGYLHAHLRRPLRLGSVFCWIWSPPHTGADAVRWLMLHATQAAAWRETGGLPGACLGSRCAAPTWASRSPPHCHPR